MRRIDRFVSMSDMKYDALVTQGVDIVERVAIPTGSSRRRPRRDRGQESRRIFHARAAEAAGCLGRARPRSRQILSSSGFVRDARNGRSLFAFERRGGPRPGASDAGARARRQAAELSCRSRPTRQRRRSRRVGDAEEISDARCAVPFALATFRDVRPRSPRGVVEDFNDPDGTGALGLRSRHRQRVARRRRRPAMALPRSGASAKIRSVGRLGAGKHQHVCLRGVFLSPRDHDHDQLRADADAYSEPRHQVAAQRFSGH